MDFIKTARNHVRDLLYTKLYKMHIKFLEEHPENEVTITLGSKGLVQVSKHRIDKTTGTATLFEKQPYDYWSWLYGE